MVIKCLGFQTVAVSLVCLKWARSLDLSRIFCFLTSFDPASARIQKRCRVTGMAECCNI